MAENERILLYKKIQSSFIWADSNQLKLWLLLLMKANHGESKTLFNGEELLLSKGQLVTGVNALESEFNKGVKPAGRVSGRTLWRWVKKFEEEGMLSIESNSKYSVMTVVNWDKYQNYKNS